MTEPTQDEINLAIYGATSRKSKYGVDTSAKGKEDRTYDNIVFDSKREMRAYRDYIKPNLNNGIFRNLRLQVRYELHSTTPGGFKVKVGAFVADAVVEDIQGKTVILETKGFRTPVYKLKKCMFEAEYSMRVTEL